jgi:hypothetical protein
VADTDRGVRFFGDRAQLLACGNGVAHRLFDEHVDAGGSDQLGRDRVGLWWGEHVHHIELLFGQHHL